MIYIGKFFHLTNQKQEDEANRRHGEFNLIVEAKDLETAVHLFKQEIMTFREKSDFFDSAVQSLAAQEARVAAAFRRTGRYRSAQAYVLEEAGYPIRGKNT